MKIKKICKKIFFRTNTDLEYEEAMKIYERENAKIIDVRDPEEFQMRHVQGAINIPIYEVESLKDEIKDKESILLLYCKTGKRSKIVKEILAQSGYRNVYTFDVKI